MKGKELGIAVNYDAVMPWSVKRARETSLLKIPNDFPGDMIAV